MELQERAAAVFSAVRDAALASGRAPEEVTLVAASKMQTPETVRAAAAAGIRVFGENRVQELTEKLAADAYADREIQFIGHLQTNKVKQVVGKVSLIQSIGSLHLAQAVEKQAAALNVVQPVLVEVNIGREEEKSGVMPEQLPRILEEMDRMPHVKVRGLMTIGPKPENSNDNCKYFAEMRQLFLDNSQKQWDNNSMEILSMGMSTDYREAIAAGATMVRVGTAIFGPRPYPAMQK